MGAGASTPGRTKRASSAAGAVSKGPLQTQASTPPNAQHTSTTEFEHIRQTFIAEKGKGVSNTELFARLSMKIPDVERDRRAITSVGDAGKHAQNACCKLATAYQRLQSCTNRAETQCRPVQITGSFSRGRVAGASTPYDVRPALKSPAVSPTNRCVVEHVCECFRSTGIVRHC